MDSQFSLVFYGRDADDGRLSLYDASISYYGLARTISILAHYYATGSIISHAPRSEVEIYLVPPEEGSFKQTIIAAVFGSVISVPFTVFATKVIESWIPPSEDPQLNQIIELLKEQNKISSDGKQKGDKEDTKEAEVVVDERHDDIQVIRSITSNSFKNIFRPIGRSAEQVAITSGPYQRPIRVVDPSVLARIESDKPDDGVITIKGVVNSFSRSSKTGVMYSEQMGRGFRFEYSFSGRLPRQDIFSWSQFYGYKIVVTGKFYRFFDGNIKKFVIYEARESTEFDDL